MTASPAAAKAVAALLKCSAPELERLRLDLDRHVAWTRNAVADADGRNARLAALRALSWFETARGRGSRVALPAAPDATDRYLDAFRMLLALELVMRNLLQERHPDPAALQRRLQELLPSEFHEAVRRGAGDPLEGLFLKHLILVFVHPDEWASIGRFFESTEFLALLDDKRETAAHFLEDIRRLRNTVAHLKRMSVLQVQLLEAYYDEIISPIRHAFAVHRTQVDPARYEASDAGAIRHYIDTVQTEIAAQARRTRRWIVATVAVSALGLAIAVVTALPAIRAWWDPDAAYVDAAERQPDLLGAIAVQACEQARPQAVARLAAQPRADRAFAGSDGRLLHWKVMTLAVEDPARLIACLPALRAMRWNPDEVVGNPVSSFFAPATGVERPPGYASFLQQHAAGELRVAPLMIAVWQQNIPFVEALRRSGAQVQTAALVDDRPFTTALDEARRIGPPELIQSLR